MKRCVKCFGVLAQTEKNKWVCLKCNTVYLLTDPSPEKEETSTELMEVNPSEESVKQEEKPKKSRRRKKK